MPPGRASRLPGISAGSICCAMDLEEPGKRERYLLVGGAEGASLGRGSYGRVCPAWDEQEERLVAIKMQRRDSETAKREMMFFQCVPKHPNVFSLQDAFVSNSGSDLCLVFEYCTHSLPDVYFRAQGVFDWSAVW